MKSRAGEGGARRRIGSGSTKADDDPIGIDILVSWVAEEVPGHLAKVSYGTKVWLTWDDVLARFPLKAGESKNRITLLKMFGDALAAQLKPAIEAQGRGKIARLHGKVDAKTFEMIVAGLNARELIEVTKSPGYVKQKSPYWRLSERGIAAKAKLAA